MSRKYKKIIDDEYKQSRDYFRKVIEEQYQKDVNKKTGTHSTLDDIAPVKKKEKERTWFDTGAFDDGWQKGDVIKTILGTTGEAATSVLEGAARMGHNLAVLTAGGVAEAADFLGKDEYADKVRNRLAGKDEETNEFLNRYSPMEKIIDVGDFFGKNSVTGEKTDSLVASAGTMLTAGALQRVIGISGNLTMGLQAAGGELENAYKSGATSEEAWKSATVTGVSEAVLNRLSGGISFGAKTLDELWKEPLTRAITNSTVKTLVRYGMDVVGEGLEEVATEAVQSLGRLSYEDKTVREALWSEEARENYIEAFIGGGVIGGGFNAKRAYNAVKTGRDYDTGLSGNEQSVIDSEVGKRTTEKQKQAAVDERVNQIIAQREKKFGTTLSETKKRKIRQNVQNQLDNGKLDFSNVEIDKKELSEIEKQVREDFDRGFIDIDSIGDMFSPEKTAQIRELNAELSKTTDEAKTAEIRAKLDELTKSRLVELDSRLEKDVYLKESLKQEVLKGMEFTRETTDNDSEITKSLVESAKSVGMNNTRRMHDLFEYVDKIANHSNYKYEFTNTAELEENAEKLKIDERGTRANGMVVEVDGEKKVLINVDSDRALNFIIGHETGHVVESAGEYAKLQKLAKEYAISKDDYEHRLKSVSKLYEGMNADIEKEVTADLIGDYLFTDEQFIKELTTERNIFQKIYDYVKRAYKMATAGSQEKRQLEKVKRSFEKAYKEIGKTTTQQTKDNLATDADSSTKFALESLSDGTEYVRVENNTYMKADGSRMTAKEVYDSLVGTTIETVDGESIYILKRLPDKNMYSELFRRYPANFRSIKDLKKLNEDVNYNFEELLENSAITDPNVPDIGGKHQKQGIVDFDTRTVSFYDGNRAYKIELSIARLQSGEKVAYAKKYFEYDSALTKKIQTEEAMSKKSQSNPQSVFDNSIAENSEDGKKQFSLSAPVEETKNLMAIHNLHGNELLKQLDMGGLAMPSIAVTKPEIIGHEGFGEVTLILNKDAIDPKASKYNKVYSADAYTPTFPSVEYEVNDEVIKRAHKTLEDATQDAPEDVKRKVYRFNPYNDIDSLLNSHGGEEGLIKWLEEDKDMKQTYLYTKGQYVDTIVSRQETALPDMVAAKYDFLIERLGADAVNEYFPKPGGTKFTQREYFEKHGEAIKGAYADYLLADGIPQETVDAVMTAMKPMDFLKEVRGAAMYLKNGPVTVKEEPDYKATNEEIDRRTDPEEYKKWLQDLFHGIEGTAGLRNDVDLFDRRGNRRNFKQLHDPVTLDNIVKIMRGKAQQKGEAFLGGNMSGASAREYKSIQDIKKDSGRLAMLPEEEHKANDEYISERLEEIAQRYAGNESWWDARNALVEAVANSETRKGIEKYLHEYDYVYKLDDSIVDDLIELRDYIRNLPTPYFEAKPQRAVGLDEVGVYVIPNNADAELKRKLLEAGYSIAEYNPDIEGDRQKVVNQFEQYKFSLSNNLAPVGNYNVYRSDVLMPEAQTAPEVPTEAPAEAPAEEIAPVVIPEELRYEEGRPLTEEDLPNFEQERSWSFDSITEDYAPEEAEEFYNTPNTAALDDKSLRLLAKNMKDELNLKPKQIKNLEKIIQDFSTSEDAGRETLYEMIEEEFGTIYEQSKIDEVVQVKSDLRDLRIKVSETIKGDIPDYFKFMQSNFGKIRFSNQGRPVDEVYEELKFVYPGYFPEDIANPTDQLLKMVEVANLDSVYTEEYFLPEKQIQDVTDFIYESVQEYKREMLMKAAHDTNMAPIDESQIPYEEKPKREIAPSNFDPNDFTVSRGVQQEYDAEAEEIVDSTHDIELERLEKRKKKAMDELGDLTSYTKQQAQTLYDEVRMMQKGKKVSADLGYILDRMFDGVDKKADNYEEVKDATYKKITDALLAIERSPAKPEKTVPPTESLIRNSIETKYGWRVSEIEGMKLDTRAEERRKLRKQLIGVNLTEALDKAKNISMMLMNNTDTIRNTELVFGRENGKIINEAIFQKEIDNEAKSIAWQNKERAEIKELGIKARSKESAAVQKYGEKQYVNEFGDLVKYGDDELAAEGFDAETQAKIRKAARIIREKYDAYIDLANETLTKLGFDPIKKRSDYMRHFQELNDVFSRYGIPFNAEAMQEHDLPTDINGLTDSWSPQKNYFANMQPRKGQRTTYDAITGIDGYIGGIANLIHHTEDIQRGRAFEEIIRETFGQEKGWENLEKLEGLSPEEYQARADKIQDNHLSNYAAWVHEWTNNIAGKKSKVDRSIESMFGRKAFALLDQVRKQVGSNMIGMNLSSSLTNLISPVQAASKTKKLAVVKGTADTIKNIFVKDDFMEKNSFLTARMGTDMLSKTAWQKVQDAGYIFMKGMDWFSSNQIVRSKYYELLSKGMTEEQAHAEAGKFAARIMGDRTKGAQAQLYNSKLIGLVTQFQLEVNNQLYSMFYDTYHESKETAKGNAARTAAGMTFTLGQLAALTHVFGKTFESIAGYNPTFDIIGIIATALGAGEDDDEKTTSERLKAAADKLVDALPYVNVLTGGGRIPIASGIPNLVGVATGGKDDYGNELTLEDELAKLRYLALPTGGNQIKKTMQGLGMFDEDLPVSGSYTDSGNLRFPVEDTPLNRAQAALFGQWASGNAQKYFDQERQPLKEKQIQEYKDLDIPIADYWEYRDGLKGLKTVEEKFDYVAGLDLPVSKKNIMINNIVDRDEKVDLINYDDFGSYDEFDWATKNPEKYDYLQSIGASYKDYAASEESKKAYNWAYENPEGYMLSKAVTGDVVKYRKIASDLYDIKADKDGNGKSISGSRKEKVAAYINSMDADYGSKIILFKSEYPSDDTYNNEIIDYLNNRQDISYADMVTILEKLEFTVDAEGNIYW